MYLLDSFTIFYFYPRPPRGGRLRLVITYSGLYDFYPRPPRGGRHQQTGSSVGCTVISIHALREEGDLVPNRLLKPCLEFLSTPSARRATKGAGCKDDGGRISIHALREEGDRLRRCSCLRRSYFYPRPPRGGRRARGSPSCRWCRFLSTPSARRATVHKRHPSRSLSISIHALREEGDQGRQQKGLRVADFYPRPPRGGRRLRWSRQSRRRDFYPRPPRGGRPGQSRPECGRGRISIHALREEGDNLLHEWYHGGANFYPRPPRGGRRRCHRCPAHGWQISIHALREEGDKDAQNEYSKGGTFLSTPSARRATFTDLGADVDNAQFLSTPSARRATLEFEGFSQGQAISIHALREEGDDGTAHAGKLPAYFYPRPPRGGRRKCRPFHGRRKDFYPRPPRGGRPRQQNRGKRTGIFLSTPSARRATCWAAQRPRTRPYFYPRPPRGGRLQTGIEYNAQIEFLSTPSARRATESL